MNFIEIDDAAGLLASVPSRGRNLQMPGDPHYQPTELRPYLGYDARIGWQVLAEWFWMTTLAESGIIPREHAELLTKEQPYKLLHITTTKVTEVERSITNA